MKKISILFSLVLLASSCVKQMEEPESAKIAGMWAVVEDNDLTNKYIKFEHGVIDVYESDHVTYYVADKSIWGCRKARFNHLSSNRYSLVDGTLHYDSSHQKMRVDGETMILGDRKCRLVENFYPEYYSTINVSVPTRSLSFNGGGVEWSYNITQPVKGFALKAKGPDWVSDLRVTADKISFTVSETTTTRTGIITLSYPSAEDMKVSVTQRTAEINLDKTSVTLGYAASSSSFTYSIPDPQDGYTLKVEASHDWITDVKDNGSGISFSVKENNSGASRTGKITVTYAGVSKVFTVTQSYTASGISLSPANGSHNYMSGTYNFKYSISNPRECQKATVSTSDTWITGVTDSGGTVSYKVSTNTTGSSRSGKITVKYGDQSKIFTITQSAASLTLSSSSATCTYASASKSFSITISNRQSDLAVSVQSDVSWITGVSESNGTVSYKVAENNSGSSRTGKITVAYAGVSRGFTVTQSYTASGISLSPANGSHDYTSGTYNFKYTISNLREGQKATVSTSDSWITGVTDTNGTVSYTVVENNSGSSRTGKITVTYAGVSKEFTVTQGHVPVDLSASATANCYIVSSAGSYYFKSVKGNSSASVGTVSSAAVLWESFGTSVTPSVGDLIKSVSYANGTITFQTADAFKEGNAVIAAKDASGTILWSWHIWFTDQPQSQVYNNNAGTMMDRNLGATSAEPGDVGALGLLYQWGRKDPFLGSSSISGSTIAKSTITWPSAVSSDSSNGTIEYATAHPTTFITRNSSNYDWYYTGSSSTDDTRWTTLDMLKSIYDPCPAGWRVPDGGFDGVWAKAGFDDTTYDSNNKGMSFIISSPSKTWYPASGYRGYDDGGLYSGGYSGGYWSASPVASFAYYLDFYFSLSTTDTIYPSSTIFRASGLSVRCFKNNF